jgi:hypothetical protein
MKCWETISGYIISGLSSSAQFHRVSQLFIYFSYFYLFTLVTYLL